MYRWPNFNHIVEERGLSGLDMYEERKEKL